MPETAPSPVGRTLAKPLIRLDAGWLFLLVGLATIGLTILIPAQHDLELAVWNRDSALIVERHREERLARYGKFLEAVRSGDEPALLSLAAIQLNKSPIDRVPLNPKPEPSNVSASIFPHLEPPQPASIPRPAITERSSILTRWSTDDKTRVWLFAGGLICIMIGLLPAAKSAPKSALAPMPAS